MLHRNELAHVMIWPEKKKGTIQLSNHDGEVLAEFEITSPVKGSELAKMMPDVWAVSLSGCLACSVAGAIEITTYGQFDTEVVTERDQPTMEERFARLERVQRRQAQIQAKLEAENRRLKTKEQEDDVVATETGVGHGSTEKPAEKAATDETEAALVGAEDGSADA